MREKVKTVFTNDLFFYAALTLFVILIGQIPMIFHIFHTPKNYYYALLDTVSPFGDYYYQSLIRYGMGSDWLVKIPYIITEHKASLIQILFVILGKISLITSVGPAEMYAIFRIIGGLTYVISVILLLRLLLNKNQARWAFVFFLFSQPLPYENLGKIFSQDFGRWIWFFTEAARRVSIMPPHYTIGRGLAILSLYFFLSYLKNKKLLSLILIFLSIFLAGIIYPPPAFILLFSILVTSNIVFLFSNKLKSKNMKHMPITGLAIFIIGCILPLFILKMELAHGYPWNMWNKVELGWNTPNMHFELDYLNTLGLLILLAPFSLFRFFNKKNITGENCFIFVWAFSAFFLFPFANLLSVGKFRLAEGAQIVPLAILSVWGLEYLLDYFQHIMDIKIVSRMKNIFLAFYIFIFFILTFFTMRHYTLSLWGYWANVYFRPDELATFSYLSKNIHPNVIVLASTHSSSYLPSFAQVRTIIGFSDFYEKFADFEYEKLKVNGILNGILSEKEAQEYLVSRKVDYVYYEKYVSGEKKLYPELLTSVYKNASFEIFRVKKT